MQRSFRSAFLACTQACPPPKYGRAAQSRQLPAHSRHRSFRMDASSATSAVHRPGRGRVFDSIVDAVGDTPIVRLRRLPLADGGHATILAKLEYFSPAASVKDRIGAA